MLYRSVPTCTISLRAVLNVQGSVGATLLVCLVPMDLCFIDQNSEEYSRERGERESEREGSFDRFMKLKEKVLWNPARVAGNNKKVIIKIN